MADSVRRHPWEDTSLGPIESWSAPVRIAVNMLLASGFPKCLVLGRDLLMIYNDGFVPILGAKAPALGCSFKDVWREAWDTIGPICDRAMAGTPTFIEDMPLDINRHGFSETAYFTFCYSPVCDETGAVIGFLDTVNETTGKVTTEHRLRDFASALGREVAERTADRDRMWRMSMDAMVVADAQAHIQSANPAFLALLGWSDFEVTGRRLSDLVHADDRVRFHAALLAMDADGATLRAEARMLHKDGTYTPLAWTGARHEGVMLAIGRDMTADRAAAEALRQTEQALQQAQKMESIGRLTGGVAHDFNNLLQVISGNLQLLSLDVAGNGRAKQRLDNALAGVNRGAQLASYLLAFARRQALEPKVVSIGRTVTDMGDMLRRTLGEASAIEIVIAPALWNTFVDTAQVENAILNLCINARDAMDGGGTLTVEVDNVLLDDDYARAHHDVRSGEYVMVAVSDTGTGMSPDVIDQAFEPFFTTKVEGKGTGLGLSMVFGFVKQSGGHVKIYSEVDHGTTVKLYLPRSLDAEDLIEKVEPRAVTGGTETILVVEDDPAVQGTVVELLKQLGYRVIKANDASSALPIVESGLPIDLLFTDVVMPGPLRSPELARKAKEILPNLAVLFTSGYTKNAITHDGRLGPGVELLGKPYTREALARKIRHVLANQKQREVMPKTAVPDPIGVVSPLALVGMPAVQAAPAPRGTHILFVEDDDVIRTITTELLESLGHTVTAASSGEHALALLSSEDSILITDIGLLGMSGDVLAAKARARFPRLRVVLASGAPAHGMMDRVAVLQKPYDLDAIECALQEASALTGR